MPRRSDGLLLLALTLTGASCGGEDTTTAPPATATTLAATTQMSPAAATTLAGPPEAGTTIMAQPPTSEIPGPVPIEISVRDGEVDGPGRVAVDLGARVAIVVTADVEDEVHLHGYDVLADIGPSSAAVIEFEATAPGVFEVELEDAGLLLVEVEVS